MEIGVSVADNINKDQQKPSKISKSSQIVGKKDAKKNKVTKIVDKAKETLDSVFQPGEDILDELWNGETDKEKEKRLAKETKQYNDRMQMVYDFALYGGVGIIAIVGMYFIYEMVK